MRAGAGIVAVTAGVALAAAAAGTRSFSADRDEAYAIVDATVAPVSGPAIPHATVLIREGLIVAVGASVAVPAGVRTLDGRGLTL
jgi:imidazolonepropionase-like amidohydrolase